MRRDQSTGRSLRYALALALVGTIPLAIWNGGCGSDTVAEPPGDAGPKDAAGDQHDATSDAGDGADAVPLQCCTEAEGNQKQCSPDGTELLTCTDWFMAAPTCASGAAGSISYGYVWLAYRCPNGCAVSTIDFQTEARCQ